MVPDEEEYADTGRRSAALLPVNLPDGTWACGDDADGHDPMIHLARPASGNYNIWVGTYSAGSTQQVGIYLSEVALK